MDLCANKDGGHNKILYKSFFDNVQKMIKSSETKEINALLSKWQDLRTICSNKDQITKIINHKITPHIASYGLMKLMKRMPIKCH